uniref:Uncharacterized protein n=1 Tax=Sphaeramia orbicularis TaxID=375764 RepID=A0A672ZML3_9TELE
MGSALGLASLTLRTWPFHCIPCTIFIALSRSSSFLKVTKANVCLPKSLILCGLRLCLPQRSHSYLPFRVIKIRCDL